MKRPGWLDLVAVNLFWLGLNLRNNAVGSIFMPYLVERFASPELRNTALGGMRTAGLVIAMLVQPAMGLLSDRSTSRFGRRRPFLLLGVLLDVVFLLWMAMAGSYWTLLAVVMLIQVSTNISHGPLQALIPDLVPEARRGLASAVKSIFELLPLILLGFTIAPLVGNKRLDLAVIATAGGLLLILALTLLLVKEKPFRGEGNSLPELKPAMLRVLGMLAGILLGGLAGLLAGGALGGLLGLAAWALWGSRQALAVGVAVGGVTAMAVAVVGGVWAGVWATLGREARRQPSFTWWIVNRLMFLAAITSIQGFAPYFLMYSFGVNSETATSMTGTLITVVGVFTLVTALPSGWLSDRIGQVRLVNLSGWLAAAGVGVLLLTIPVPSLALIYTAGGILGLATGLFVTTNWALGTRLAPSSEPGRYLGISNLAGGGAGMVGAGIGGPVADYLNGLLPGLGYFTIFAGYGLLFCLGSLSLRGVLQPTPGAGAALEPAAQ